MSKAKQTREQLDARPHIVKTRHFLSVFPHELESTEWVVRWPIIHFYGKTYNPDFWCKDMECFIELATSKGNVMAEGEKWAKAIGLGYQLRVFWWEGNEITNTIIERYKNGQ